MSRSSRPNRSQLQASLVVRAFLIAAVSLVTGQSAFASNSAEKIDNLKRAVVIVTTVDRQGRPLLQGSGFFIAADRIVTNLHVIKDAGFISVEMYDGATRKVQSVLARNEPEDLALLQLAAPELNAAILQLADFAAVEGESIMVMSNPRASRWKLTQGSVGRSWQFKGTGKRIQITASILPGSSGAPVVNRTGHVVAIAVMHMDSTADLNFAVPAESLRALQASARFVALPHPASGR